MTDSPEGFELPDAFRNQINDVARELLDSPALRELVGSINQSARIALLGPELRATIEGITARLRPQMPALLEVARAYEADVAMPFSVVVADTAPADDSASGTVTPGPASSGIATNQTAVSVATFGSIYFMVQEALEQDLRDMAGATAVTVMLMITLMLIDQLRRGS